MAAPLYGGGALRNRELLQPCTRTQPQPLTRSAVLQTKSMHWSWMLAHINAEQALPGRTAQRLSSARCAESCDTCKLGNLHGKHRHMQWRAANARHGP